MECCGPVHHGAVRYRQRVIEGVIERDGQVAVADLARWFNVSAVTVRKDLASLEVGGRIARTHGGAVLADRDRPEGAFETRLRVHRADKEAIARAAAGLVIDGQSIVLDASTTAVYLARTLRGRPGWTRLTVLTNGLVAAAELGSVAGIRTFMPAGKLRGGALSLVDEVGLDRTDHRSVDTAFVGATGLTVESGVFETTHDEAAMKAAMIKDARQIVAVVDSSKLGRRGVAVFCPLARIALVVTDGGVPPALVAGLERAGIPIRVADGVGRGAWPRSAADVVGRRTSS